jgi:hypothetical protein
MLPLLFAMALIQAPAPVRRIVVEPVAVSGTLRVFASDGTLVRPKRGTVTVWFRHSLDWHPQDITVVDGEWSATVPSPCAGVDIGRVEVDGNEAYVSRGVWPDDPGRSPIHFAAQLAKRVHLTVVDDATGAPIEGFEVRELAVYANECMPLRIGEGWVAKRDGTGAFLLPAWSLDPDPEFVPGVQWTPKRSFWVKAEGYAWARVDSDFDRGGDVVARLRPASSLRVQLSHQRGVPGCLLRLRIDGTLSSIELDPWGAEHLFENLPAAPLELILLDSSTRPPHELARRATTLVAGAEGLIRF